MDIALRHALTYSTERDVPVALVARSLLANEALVINSLRILEKSVPGLAIESISVKVAELSNSSPLREVLVAAIVVTLQKDLVEEVPDLIEKLTGLNVPDRFDSLLTLMVVATALYAVSTAVERLMPGKSAKKLIEEYERKKERLSELTGLDKQTVERFTAERVGTEKGFLKQVLDFFAPAKLEPGASILLPSGETISSEAISEVPIDADANQKWPTNTYGLDGVVIDVHRSDMDENKHGWRGVIGAVSDRKVRMELSPQINPGDLYGHTSIVADVIVVEERQSDAAFTPKLYQVLRVWSKKQD